VTFCRIHFSKLQFFLRVRSSIQGSLLELLLRIVVAQAVLDSKLGSFFVNSGHYLHSISA
jgi:hypothetical protein